MALIKMPRRAAQLNLPLRSTWGGRREGAGRKPIPGRRRQTPHRARPLHRARHPVHLTMRVRPGIRSLRHASLFPAVRAAIVAASGTAFRVVQFSVQSDHLHLIVEAADKASLSSGARGLSIRIALAVNRVLERSGPVWGDRYHARPLSTPREVRNGLVYVLMNFRKHVPSAPPARDRCSSAPWFDGFRDGPPTANDPPVTAKPRTWLATIGWRRYGLIRLSERPLGPPREKKLNQPP